jgi:alpha-1,2-mannosyltransferase
MTLQRPLERPAVRRAATVALALLVILFAYQTWRKAHRPDGYDLTSYLLAARALTSGTNPYEVPTPFPYIYPLFPLVAVIPLSLVPYGAAVLIWFALSAAALAWVLRWVSRREAAAGGARDAIPIAVIVVLLLTSVVQNNFLNGQINFLVLACCIAAAAGGVGQAGARAIAWWAVAIATKILPVGLAPWWIVRRRPVVVAGALVLAALLAMSPALVAGPAAIGWTADYARAFLGGSLETGAPDDALRFSLFGMTTMIVPGVPWLPVVCGLIVLGAATAIDLRGGARPDDHVAYVLYLAAIPLASPKSEVHHLAFTIPAAYVCALRVLRYRVGHGDWRRRAAIASAALFAVASLFDAGRSVLMFGSQVLLCASVAGMLLQDTRSGAPEQRW